MHQQNNPCPTCGYCPTCGRKNGNLPPIRESLSAQAQLEIQKFQQGNNIANCQAL